MTLEIADAWESLPPELDPDAWDYLAGRGLSDVADLCRTPSTSADGEIGRLVAKGFRLAVAMRDPHGRVVAIQLRRIDGEKDFRAIGPTGQSVFGEPRALVDAKTVVIAEGLTDFLAASASLRGAEDVAVIGVAGVANIGGVKALPLTGKRVMLAMDADKPGDECAVRLAEQLAELGVTTHRVRPEGGKDVADMLRAGEDLRVFLTTPPNGFRSSKKRIDTERPERQAAASNRLTFGIEFLDAALGGIFLGDLVLLGAKTGVGKTEAAKIIAKENARRKKRVHYFALEAENNEIERRIKYEIIVRLFLARHPPSDLIERLSYLDWYMGALEDVLGRYEAEADRIIATTYSTLSTFYRARDFSASQFERIVGEIQHQTDLIILDHLHYVDSDDDNENRGFKQIVKTIRDTQLAVRKPVILVAHVRKSDRRVSQLLPGIEDFHGSSDVPKIATKAVMLGPAFDQPSIAPHLWGTYMGIEKCRLDGTRTRYVGLATFDAQTSSYQEQFRLGRVFRNSKGQEEFSPVAEADYPHWAARALRQIDERRVQARPQQALGLVAVPVAVASAAVPARTATAKAYRHPYAPDVDDDAPPREPSQHAEEDDTP